jgi:hypothetical protein
MIAPATSGVWPSLCGLGETLALTADNGLWATATKWKFRRRLKRPMALPFTGNHSGALTPSA